MPAVSTILHAAAGGDVARVIVVASNGAAPDELLHGARDVGAEIVVTGDLLWAFSDAALAGRLEAIRSAWGLANAGRTVIVGVEPVNEEDWRELEQAKAAFLPEAALLRWAGVSGQPSTGSRQGEENRTAEERKNDGMRAEVAGVAIEEPGTRNLPASGTQHPALSTPLTASAATQSLVELVALSPPALRLAHKAAESDAAIPREQEDADDERPTLTREELAMLLGPLDDDGAGTTLPAGARSGGGT
ncbi:MAG: hypothetical protein HRU76_00795 [Phycisphaeraceae bacterium]|nr:hypothetical protein [Phycisphaerales bacterium]QOJ16220.1 MAG: hypothetical protein HRU76_00795 [Phycisphaeraceae bacterium]